MTTKDELEARIAELEREMFVGKVIGEMSYGLNTARDEAELLEVLSQPARDAGATSAQLFYIDLDEDSQPEWAEMVAVWRREGKTTIPVEARFHLAEFPFAKLWIAHPDEPQLITDVATDEKLDDNLKGSLTQDGIRSIVILPLVHAGRWVGLGSFNWHGERHEFGEQETETYRALPGLAAPVVENRRLLAQTQQSLIERQEAEAERERLQEEVIQAQKHAIQELSTPVIPIMDRIIVMPLIGSIDTMRARDITRSLLAGITQHRAKIVIVDVTGVSIMDTGIVNHLNKTIQAARLKGAHTIVTGISDSVAEAIVDLGIDWSEITTLSDLQTGLLTALSNLGVKLS